jgi:hypothetical protein
MKGVKYTLPKHTGSDILLGLKNYLKPCCSNILSIFAYYFLSPPRSWVQSPVRPFLSLQGCQQISGESLKTPGLRATVKFLLVMLLIFDGRSPATEGAAWGENLNCVWSHLRHIPVAKSAEDVMVLPCDFTAVCHDSKTKKSI